MQRTQEFIQNNKQRFVEELIDILRIPSISADAAYADAVHQAADEIADKIRQAGADLVEVCETDGYPIVYGEKMVDPNLPTVLVYGHYDVQPADPIELWTSPARLLGLQMKSHPYRDR